MGLKASQRKALSKSLTNFSKREVGVFWEGSIEYRIPLDWFRISGYLYDIFEKVVKHDKENTFMYLLDSSEFNWVRSKLIQYSNGPREGAFWDNINKGYRDAGLSMHSSTNLDQVPLVNLDVKSEREEFLKKLKFLSEGHDDEDWDNQEEQEKFKDIKRNDISLVRLDGTVGYRAYIPTNFIRISERLNEIFKNSISTLSRDDQEFVDGVVGDYREYCRGNVDAYDLRDKDTFPPEISEFYGVNLPDASTYQMDMAIRADNLAGRKKLKKLLEKEKDVMNNEDDLDYVLDTISYDESTDVYTINKGKRGARKAKKTKTKKTKGQNMLRDAKNTVVREVKELVNQSGAADIALGRLLYNNIKAVAGKTIVNISFIDRAVAKVSKKMKYKNEVTELIAVLTMLVVLKQFYDHKALENVRGYIVNRLYNITIEATGFDDVLALITQAESQAIND